MAQGTELAVTSAKGERVAVSLKGAASAVSKFKTCFGEREAVSALAPSSTQHK